MEEIESARTIECLRGRLLAERSATKLARHQAELMQDKLAELENRLSQETKCKNKADKKLRFLLEKLHSKKIDYVLKETEDRGGSAVSLLVAADAKQEPVLDSNPEGCNKSNVAQSVTGSMSSKCSEEFLSTISNNSDLNGKEDGSVENFTGLKSEQSFDGAKCIKQSTEGSKSSRYELALNNEFKVEDTNNDTDGDNSLALVSVPSGFETSSSEYTDGELKKGSSYRGALSDALDALRQAREEIQKSMDRRSMIKVGWPQLIPS